MVGSRSSSTHMREDAKSVLSGKEAIDGLPKSSAAPGRRTSEPCESALDGPQCIDTGSRQKSKQRRTQQ
jgi:hypothetical protein